jgi:hypothetical protein
MRKLAKRIIPMEGKKILVFHCEESIYSKLLQTAEYQYTKPETLIDNIVRGFIPSFEDVLHFMKGGYDLSFKDKIVNLLRQKEPKLFITMQVDEKTYEKLVNAKRYYGMNRSMVLKYIINQYINSMEKCKVAK